jgi:hypothetical protein
MRSHLTPLVLLLALASCGEGVGPFRGGGVQTVPTSTCVSGQQWQGGHEGSSAMDPGQDCIACHNSGEGPNYSAAGTVFKNLGEADDCTGVAGVTVEITGADGGVTTLTTNSVGNFYTRQFIETPYSVKLISGTNTRIMAGHQTTGACNSCHTATGTSSAPGRIMAP